MQVAAVMNIAYGADNDINEVVDPADPRWEEVLARIRARDLARKMAPILDKETNMKNRLQRRRAAIWDKWSARAWATAGICVLLFFVIPLLLKLSTLCWVWVLS